jgi:hypothetical protein
VKAIGHRESSGAAVLVGVAAVAVAHTMLRDARWAYEWRWASFQYHLATLLVAPVAAIAAGWEGVTLRRAGEPIVAAGRTLAFGARAILRVLGWVVGGYLLGAVPVVVVVWRARGIEAAPADALVMFVPALAQLAAVVAVSYVLGWLIGHPLVVPALGAGWFAGLIAAHLLLPDELVRVGGATASLVGLQVPGRTQLLQVSGALAVGAGGLVLLWVVDQRGTEPARRLAVPLVVGVLALAGLSTLHRPSEAHFEPVGVEEVCHGRAPALCVAPEYVPVVPRLARVLAPALAEVADLGATVPRAMHQDPAAGAALADLIRGGEVHLPSAVVASWEDPGCAALADPESAVNEARFRWAEYLRARLADERARATGAEAAELRADARRIIACAPG